MSSMLDGLMKELGSEGVGRIATQLGVDETQARSALDGALPMLLGALARNASSGEGADALHGALQQHTGVGSVLDQLGKVVGNAAAQQDGNAILGHILGKQQGSATQGLAQTSGLDASKVSGLLSTLAPLVMGYLARQSTQQSLDSGQLSNTLGQQLQQLQNSGLGGSLLNALLGGGKDGEGSTLSNVLSAGASILGSLGKR